ncbi:MAG TPA: alpha/beta hydrolase [candidate division Zixibacteria bacterium]|jgi:acetyl esterase/lipase
MKRTLSSAILFGGVSVVALATSSAAVESAAWEPVAYVYSVIGSDSLHAYMFEPVADGDSGTHAAVIVFHGGGWHMGEASWSFPKARHLASLGMVAVAAEYRLSDQKAVTPLEAMADARAIFRWLRSRADEFDIDPNCIAGYGWSAGAHLAACAAIFGDTAPGDSISAAPNALVLVSPAVNLKDDGWVEKILMSRAEPGDISPADHVRAGLPPTMILIGETDTVTPLRGAQLFCDRVRAAGNGCEMRVYPKVGHLFTPSHLRDDGMPQSDPKVSAEATAAADSFLVGLGYADW